jgi:hypothetical protein
MTGSTATREVAFIDITVADYQILVEGVRPGVEIVLLGGWFRSPDADGRVGADTQRL